MFTRLIAIIACLTAFGGISGCRCPSGCCVPGTPTMPCVESYEDVATTPPDLVQLVSVEAEPIPLPSPDQTFQVLSAGNCQCMAATNAPVANMVELERHWAKVIIECDTKAVRENYCLDRDLLSLHANGVRNESAALALKAFYQLAGLEAKQHFLQLAIEETEQSKERIENLRKKGVKLPEGVDYGAVQSQLHDLKDTQFQLEYSRLQLNGQLQKLIDCPLNEYNFYWPEVYWEIDLEPVDVETEVTYGLANRTDLRGLQLVLCKMRKVTLPVARAVLSYADGVIGSVEPRDGLRHWIRCCQCNDAEVPIRCRQLSIFYTDTEHKATAEIKSAAYNVALQQERLKSTRATVETLRKRVKELTGTRDVANVAAFKISKARGDLYHTEINFIQHATELYLAKVELKRAQGVLAIECGIVPCLCCEGCCDGACCQCLKKCGCKTNCSPCKRRKCECCNKRTGNGAEIPSSAESPTPASEPLVPDAEQLPPGV